MKSKLFSYFNCWICEKLVLQQPSIGPASADICPECELENTKRYNEDDWRIER